MRRTIGRAINQLVGTFFAFVVGTIALIGTAASFLENQNVSPEKFDTYLSWILFPIIFLIFIIISVYEHKKTAKIKEAERLAEQRKAKRERLVLLEQSRIKKMGRTDLNNDPYFLGEEFSGTKPSYDFNQEDFAIYFKVLELPNIPTSLNTIESQFNALMKKYAHKSNENDDKKIKMLQLCYRQLKAVYPDFVE